MYSISNVIPYDKKVFCYLNEPLWKLCIFKNKPCPNILMGDSRIGGIRVEDLEIFTGKPYTNLSMGSANFPEINSTFWFLSNHVPLKTVYIGINLEVYNQQNSRNRVDGAVSIIENHVGYFTNYNVLGSTFLCIKNTITGRWTYLGTPAKTKNLFWKSQLEVNGQRYYSNYVYPESYFEELKKIGFFCSLHKIKLVFLVLPTHTDLQHLLRKMNLDRAEKRMISDLCQVGEVYVFNLMNALTDDRENFGDPFHAKKIIYDSISSIVFLGRHAPGDSSDFYHHYIKRR